jgi:DNA invertase Pin-like site-specific DNA recombinase
VSRAASYIRTDPDGELASQEQQYASIEAYAAENGHELAAHYEDLNAPGTLLYHRPGIKAAINNIKEEEDWEILIVADPGTISDTETARHEFVHKFSLYNNRIESPQRDWESLLSEMRAYRRSMSQR